MLKIKLKKTKSGYFFPSVILYYFNKANAQNNNENTKFVVDFN